jgi:two-component sensor histidine kinase
LLTSQSADPPHPSDSDDQLLFDRIRLGMVLILSGVAVVFLGALLFPPGSRLWINSFQAVNFIVVLLALLFVTDPAQRTRNFTLGITAYVVTIIATGAVGIAAGDATTPVILLVGLAVVSATLVPWSPWWQFLTVLLIAATDICTVATVIPSPRLFWLQNVGTIAPTLAATVVIARVLHRQRVALANAERDRRSREESLREANRRLETEIHEHQGTEDALRFAMRELDHRVKNTLAIVQSVAEQTLRGASSMRDFGAAFTGRLQAMARIHTALAEGRWQGLPLTQLIELVVGPYGRYRESIVVDGDGAFVSSDLARVLGLTLHELATNAAKYGALSTTTGRVAISARVESDAEQQLHITWCERNGPPVVVPTRRGFGMQMIEDALVYEVDGRVEVHFPPEGLRCEIRIPMHEGAR